MPHHYLLSLWKLLLSVKPDYFESYVFPLCLNDFLLSIQFLFLSVRSLWNLTFYISSSFSLFSFVYPFFDLSYSLIFLSFFLLCWMDVNADFHSCACKHVEIWLRYGISIFFLLIYSFRFVGNVRSLSFSSQKIVLFRSQNTLLFLSLSFSSNLPNRIDCFLLWGCYREKQQL